MLANGIDVKAATNEERGSRDHCQDVCGAAVLLEKPLQIPFPRIICIDRDGHWECQLPLRCVVITRPNGANRLNERRDEHGLMEYHVSHYSFSIFRAHLFGFPIDADGFDILTRFNNENVSECC